MRRGDERDRLTEVLDALSRRRRLARAVAGCAALLVCILAVGLGLRSASLAARYPDPAHERASAGRAVPYPGHPDVTVKVVSGGYIPERDFQALCPDFFGGLREIPGEKRFIRVDTEVANGGSEDFSAAEFAMSSVVIGDSYANGAALPAMTEAFPEMGYGSVAPGETRRMTFLYVVFDTSFDDAQWAGLERLPLGFQFNIWPKTMTVELCA